MNKKFKQLGFYPADILLPENADMSKWAVVACDQFTSQPEYWEAVEKNVGDTPSTLRLILPEAKLNDPDVEQHIADINGAMKRYVDSGVFKTLPASLIYMERTQSDGNPAPKRGFYSVLHRTLRLSARCKPELLGLEKRGRGIPARALRRTVFRPVSISLPRTGASRR